MIESLYKVQGDYSFDQTEEKELRTLNASSIDEHDQKIIDLHGQMNSPPVAEGVFGFDDLGSPILDEEDDFLIRGLLGLFAHCGFDANHEVEVRHNDRDYVLRFGAQGMSIGLKNGSNFLPLIIVSIRDTYEGAKSYKIFAKYIEAVSNSNQLIAAFMAKADPRVGAIMEFVLSGVVNNNVISSGQSDELLGLISGTYRVPVQQTQPILSNEINNDPIQRQSKLTHGRLVHPVSVFRGAVPDEASGACFHPDASNIEKALVSLFSHIGLGEFAWHTVLVDGKNYRLIISSHSLSISEIVDGNQKPIIKIDLIAEIPATQIFTGYNFSVRGVDIPSNVNKVITALIVVADSNIREMLNFILSNIWVYIRAERGHSDPRSSRGAHDAVR